MQLKTLALAAVVATTSAQDGNTTSQSLNQTLAGNPDLSNLTSFLAALPEFTSQLASLQNVTLLAPNNAAFAEFLNSSAGSALSSGGNDTTGLIQAILSYHILNGTYQTFGENMSFVPTALMPPTYANVTGGQRVEVIPGSGGNVTFLSGLLSNSSTVGNATNFTGGVVHVIDRFLVPPQNVSETAVQANLTGVVGALRATNLTDSIDSLQDLTIFAPDNAAFEAIANLVANASAQDLMSILEYHVVRGTVGYSTDLMNGSTLQTLNGFNVTIRIEDGNVFVNSAKVTVPNVLVANGVVHIVDAVLNPANTTATPNPSETGGVPAFSGASSGSLGAVTSGVATPTASLNPTSEASAATSSSSSGGAMPMMTGAIAPAALFGGAALLANL